MKTALVLLAVLGGALFPRTALAQLPTSQVVLENASIRVTLLTFAPGGATGRHQGIESEIGIVVDGELTVESPTGRQNLGPGRRLLDAGAHASRCAQRERPPGQALGHLPQALRLIRLEGASRTGPPPAAELGLMATWSARTPCSGRG